MMSNILIVLIALRAQSLVGVSGLKVLSTEEKSCKVTTDKGRVDLSGVAKSDGSARFTKSSGGIGGTTFLWNPCYNFHGSSEECKNVEVCAVYNENFGSSFGTKDQANFTADGDDLLLEYTTAPSVTTVKIKLICGTSETDDFELGTNDFWKWSLTSRHCCFLAPVPSSPPASSKGLSAGSVLCIILLVVVVVYVTSAVLYYKLKKDVESYKQVPHYKLCELTFSSFKEGVGFAIKCGKTERSSNNYDNI